jgi:hypothetical protein
MALINCPECSSEVSDKAGDCPKCGFPLKKKKDRVKTEDQGYFLQFMNVGCLAVVIFLVLAMLYLIS